LFVDLWSGAEFEPTVGDDASAAELAAAEGQFFDARLVGGGDPPVLVVLPGAVFHPRAASHAIGGVLAAARHAALSTHDTLDALLRMQRSMRSLARVKPEYAYRADALFPGSPRTPAVRAGSKPLT
jgi:hypothetical protein